MESAGDVRARDDVEQRVVVAESPHPEPLTEVGVEVDEHRLTLSPPPSRGPQKVHELSSPRRAIRRRGPDNS
jgi:hypothetical protein